MELREKGQVYVGLDQKVWLGPPKKQTNFVRQYCIMVKTVASGGTLLGFEPQLLLLFFQSLCLGFPIDKTEIIKMWVYKIVEKIKRHKNT